MKWKTQDVLAALGYVLLFGLCYAACFLAIGDPFAYGGGVFTTVVIYVVAQIAGFLFQLIRLPALLGMLLSGMLLVNALPQLVAGLPPTWSSGFRALALGTIFLRSGLELDLKVFRRVGPVAFRLLLIPGVVEAFTDGGMAMAVFGMPWAYAFTLGFILKAVGPAIVIQTMFELQKGGWGVAKGIPSTIVAAASFDDMVAITGYSLFSNLAIRDPASSLAWQLLHGPLDILFGTCAGVVGAMFCSCTKLWNTRLKRVVVVFATAQGLLFLLYEFKFKAGGALSALVLGLVANVLWAKGGHVPLVNCVPGYLSIGPNEHISHEVEMVVGVFWRWAAQPLLFGIIGTLMNFRKEGFVFSYIPKALAIIAVGLSVRVPTTFLCMAKAGLTIKERLFVAFAWTPKATVQAALGALPLSTIIDVYGASSPDVVYGDMILTTSIFAILVCAPLGVLLIQFTHKQLLQQMPVMFAGASRASRTFVAAGTQYDPDDITDAPDSSIRVPRSLTDKTDAQTDDLKPLEALRRRMLSESLARRRLSAQRRIAADAAIAAVCDSSAEQESAVVRATGAAMARSLTSSGNFNNSSSNHNPSTGARSALSCPSPGTAIQPVENNPNAASADGQRSVDSRTDDSALAAHMTVPETAFQFNAQHDLHGGVPVVLSTTRSVKVVRSASSSGLPLTAAAALATAGVCSQAALSSVHSQAAAVMNTGSIPTGVASEPPGSCAAATERAGLIGVAAQWPGPSGAAAERSGSSATLEKRPVSSGVTDARAADWLGANSSALPHRTPPDAWSGQSAEGVGAAGADTSLVSSEFAERDMTVSHSVDVGAAPSIAPVPGFDENASGEGIQPTDIMFRLTMQDALQTTPVRTIDEALARYFAETERLLDMVEGGVLSSEAGHSAAIKLRANLRLVCKRLAAETLPVEAESGAEDSELATTFFRMADRTVLPTQDEVSANNQAVARAMSVELTQVAVASAS